MSDVTISNMAEYRAGKVQADADYRLGAPYASVFPRTSSESFLAGWMSGWDAAASRYGQ
jgi:hypothetical protein